MVPTRRSPASSRRPRASITTVREGQAPPSRAPTGPRLTLLLGALCLACNGSDPEASGGETLSLSASAGVSGGPTATGASAATEGSSAGSTTQATSAESSTEATSSTDGETSTGTSGGSASTSEGGSSSTGDAPPHTYACEPVGTSYSDGFFSLREFKGRLHAGLFGYGHENTSMLYRYAPWELAAPGLLGVSESVCALIEWQGWLYANTESSADIARSADGSHWETVYDGPEHTIGCGLEVFGEHLYAVHYDNADQEEGQILRTANGVDWEVVWSSGPEPWYVRELVAHDGVLHAFAVDESSKQGWRLSSTNGAEWSAHTTPSRFFRGRSWGDALWIGSSDRTSSGIAGIWRYSGGEEGDAELVQEIGKHYVTALAPWDGKLWAATSDGWKEDQGTSTLLGSATGASWETICEFPEVAAWALATSGEHLYVGTWEYQVGGKVYEVRIVEGDTGDSGDSGDSGEEIDCAQIPAANPAWELCEAGRDQCEGVYSDGAGCASFCAAAGLVCVGRFGGEPGCAKEQAMPIPCDADNGHASDWCVCGPG